MSKETFGEQIGRLKSMSEPAGTWDLSQNDMAAIRAVLASHEELLGAVQDLLEAIPPQNNDQDWWPDELTRAVREANKAIDKAEAA
jgi:hypothetical protein